MTGCVLLVIGARSSLHGGHDRTPADRAVNIEHRKAIPQVRLVIFFYPVSEPTGHKFAAARGSNTSGSVMVVMVIGESATRLR